MFETKKIHLLVVEDKMSEYMPLRRSLEERFPKNTEIFQADSLLEGLNYAIQNHCTAILLSYRLPDGTAGELIETIKSRYQGMGRRDIVFFLFFEPASTETNYASLLRRFPDITLIEKPYLPNEVAKLVREIVLPTLASDASHYNLGLYDLIQAYVLSRQSVTLRVMDEFTGMGTIAIRRGNLVHAARGAILGLDALVEIAQMRNARIRLERGCHTAMETITLQPQEALCEAARIIGEQRSHQLVTGSTDGDGRGKKGHKKGAAVAMDDSPTVFDGTPREHTHITEADALAENQPLGDPAATMINRPEDTIVIEPSATRITRRGEE
jgi:CheY-like chemotaxis protein